MSYLFYRFNEWRTLSDDKSSARGKTSKIVHLESAAQKSFVVRLKISEAVDVAVQFPKG